MKNVTATRERSKTSGQFCQQCSAWRGELGQEPTVALFVAHLVAVFREVKRVLRRDGLLFVNLGDSYAGNGHMGQQGQTGQRATRTFTATGQKPKTEAPSKSLMLIPHRFAIAMCDDGWICRQDNVWEKVNSLPESVTDRTTRSHEYIFMFAKAERYYYDAAAIAEPAVRPGDTQTFGGQKGRNYQPEPGDPNYRHGSEQWGRTITMGATRNARSVWSIPTEPNRASHYAVMPTALVEKCLLAGSRPGDLVLDPFSGLATVALVAQRTGRDYLGIELNSEYVKLSEERLLRDTLPAPMKAVALDLIPPRLFDVKEDA